MACHYDDNNIFSKIISKEIPAVIVYEDDTSIAFMDVMPQEEGHLLLIPKQGSRNLLDAQPQLLQELILKVQKLAQAIKIAFHADGVMVCQYNEAAAGQSVFHLHFHIIPRFNNKPLRGHSKDSSAIERSDLEKQAEKIRHALSTLANKP